MRITCYILNYTFIIIFIFSGCGKKNPATTNDQNIDNAVNDSVYDPNAGNQNYNPAQNNPSNTGNQPAIPSSCGNNRIDVGEQCDTVDFNQQTCETLGYAKGKLGCAVNCQFDTSQCTACGNTKIDTDKGEECDGSLIPENKTCKELGFGGGIITCTDTCMINTTQCYEAIAQNFALSLDGVSDLLFAETFEKDGYDFSQGISFEAWVYPSLSPDCDANDNWRYFLSSDQIENFSLKYLENQHLLATIQTLTEKEDGTVGLNEVPIKSRNASAIIPKQWSHIAVTYNPQTGLVTHYKNGNITSVSFGQTEKPVLVHQLIIGGDIDNVSFCPNQKGNFRGIIDEVRIWNKTLTLEDIRARRYQHISESDSGLIAYYDFDEIYESPGYDASSKQNHAIVFGNPQRVIATWNRCGDNHIDEHEYCDPQPPAFETCVSYGYLSGTITCNGICDINTTACQRQDADLIAWYSFENDISDSKKVTDDSGHNLNGERKPDTLVTGIYGFGQAVKAQENIISITSNNDLKTLIEFSLEAWMKPDDLKDAAVLSKGDNTANHLDYALLTKNSGKIVLQLDAAAGKTGTLIESNDTILLKNDFWNHIAVTFKQSQDEPAADNISFFINGIAAGGGKFKGPFNGSDAALLLGGNEFGQKNFFNGIMDDIKIFKKVRTQKQVCEDSGGFFDENTEAKCHIGNHALHFDGSNDRVVIQNSKSLAFENQFTLAVRLRSNSNTNTIMRVFEQNKSMLSINENGKVEAILHTVDPQKTGDTGISSSPILSSSIINDQRWHTVILTYDGSAILLYIDNVLENMTFHNGNLGNGQTNRMIMIGSQQDGNAQSFKGSIDRFALWNHALEKSEVAQFQEQSGITQQGLSAFYEFNDAFGSIAKDTSSNKNDGMLGETNISDEKDPSWIIVSNR